jgi:hypothetical protein
MYVTLVSISYRHLTSDSSEEDLFIYCMYHLSSEHGYYIVNTLLPHYKKQWLEM